MQITYDSQPSLRTEERKIYTRTSEKNNMIVRDGTGANNMRVYNNIRLLYNGFMRKIYER